MKTKPYRKPAHKNKAICVPQSRGAEIPAQNRYCLRINKLKIPSSRLTNRKAPTSGINMPNDPLAGQGNTSLLKAKIIFQGSKAKNETAAATK
jgi:hypothetical protein